MNIRPFQPEDESQLADLYEATVRRWAPGLYTHQQVEAWATAARENEHFHRMLSEGQTFVAVDLSDQPLGFSGVEYDGRVASLYVAASSTRQGIGTALLRRVMLFARREKIQPLWTEASFLSRALFERHGFKVANAEHIVFNGVEFKRWLMRQPVKHNG